MTGTRVHRINRAGVRSPVPSGGASLGFKKLLDKMKYFEGKKKNKLREKTSLQARIIKLKNFKNLEFKEGIACLLACLLA